MNVDLDALEEQAKEAESRTIPGVYFAVLVPGDVLLELVRMTRARYAASTWGDEPAKE